MPINYERKQRVADRMIKKYGAKCYLRRNTNEDRVCWAAVIDFQPQDNQGRPIGPVRREALISAKDLAVGPNHEKDYLVTLVPGTTTVAEILKFSKPVAPLAPAGVVVYYDCEVESR